MCDCEMRIEFPVIPYLFPLLLINIGGIPSPLQQSNLCIHHIHFLILVLISRSSLTHLPTLHSSLRLLMSHFKTTPYMHLPSFQTKNFIISSLFSLSLSRTSLTIINCIPPSHSHIYAFPTSKFIDLYFVITSTFYFVVYSYWWNHVLSFWVIVNDKNTSTNSTTTIIITAFLPPLTPVLYISFPFASLNKLSNFCSIAWLFFFCLID